MIAATFEKPWVRQLWEGFVAARLAENLYSPHVVRRIAHAGDFFRTIEAQFEKSSDINTQALANIFSSKAMRRHLVASRHVVKVLALVGVETERKEQAERVRIAAVFARAEFCAYRTLLLIYCSYLQVDSKPLRTIRLYVSAAEVFCRTTGMDVPHPWEEETMLNFLRASPGLAANLSCFVSFCRMHYLWEVRMPKKSERKPLEARAERDVQKLRKLLSAIDASGETRIAPKALVRILSLALGVPATRLTVARDRGEVATNHDGTILLYEDAVIGVQDPLYQFAKQWLSNTAARQVRN